MSDQSQTTSAGLTLPHNEQWWRCYYAAFTRVHRRKSDGHELDSIIVAIVDAVFEELQINART